MPPGGSEQELAALRQVQVRGHGLKQGGGTIFTFSAKPDARPGSLPALDGMLRSCHYCTHVPHVHVSTHKLCVCL